MASSSRLPLHLVVGTGTVIFVANAALLVLQLTAVRILIPFIYSSIETWTCVIGVFLTGIALGNWLGGRLADRWDSPRTLSILLALGGLASLGMIAIERYTAANGFYQSLSLELRRPLLTVLFCLLPATILSLITPITIKLALPNLNRAGRAAGFVFALSTLGSVLGNYLTGFWLLADLTLDTIAAGTGFALLGLSIPVWFLCPPSQIPSSELPILEREAPLSEGWVDFRNDNRLAYALVFLTSFCAMSLELTASRLLAPELGVSLFTWTGIVGVMLAGTAVGNYLGGVMADRGIAAAFRRFGLIAGQLIGFAIGPMVLREIHAESLESLELVARCLGASIGLFLATLAVISGRSREGARFVLLCLGGLIGATFSLPTWRGLQPFIGPAFESRPLIIPAIGFAFGMGIAGLFLIDVPAKGERTSRSSLLSGTYLLAGATALLVLFLIGMFRNYPFMRAGGDVVESVLAWTFGLFFLPMLLLGTISPQVIRLSIPTMERAGRVAGAVYAWSTIGAVVGTFATGYFLIASVGMFRVLLGISLLLTLLAFFIGRLWRNNAVLYAASIVVGGAIFGMAVVGSGGTHFERETRYYAITVETSMEDDRRIVKLTLDRLLHSAVDLNDPLWLHYKHEEVQGELLRQAASRGGETNLLVIGGGGYTFPHWVEIMLPEVKVEVVEIDPGVTQVAHDRMGLPRDTHIVSHHMDGRRFVVEHAPPGHYQFIMQDAVNDLSVPYHLLTKEYNDAVKRILAPDGVYLLTLIDSLQLEPAPAKGIFWIAPKDKADGANLHPESASIMRVKLWQAAVSTLRETFRYVHLLSAKTFDDPSAREVFVLYASDRELDLQALRDTALASNRRHWSELGVVVPGPVLTALKDRVWTHQLPDDELEELLNRSPRLVLTDQYAPVDNLMAEQFRMAALAWERYRREHEDR